jgi:glycosyltransferase involved in cell wall biosynthesis
MVFENVTSTGGSVSSLVSIGLPVFNGERFLRPSLDSIVTQTYGATEIIIADNASTDSSVAICEEYAARDPRIRLLRGEVNRGAAWNHNRVLQEAQGEYFKWGAADDVMAPRFLECCVAALENRRDAVLAFPLTTVIDDAGKAIRRTTDRLPLDSSDPVLRFRSLLSSLSHTHNPFYGLMRRATLLRAHRLGSFPASDRALLLELALLGSFLQVEEFLMFRRDHEAQQKRTLQAEQLMLDPAFAGHFLTREWMMLFRQLRSWLQMKATLAFRLRIIGAVGWWAFAQRRVLVAESREFAGYALRRSLPRKASRLF